MGLLMFFMWCKILTLIASGILTNAQGGTWYNPSDLIGLWGGREAELDFWTAVVSPLLMVEFLSRIAVWREAVFHELWPFGELVSVVMTLLSGFAVLSAFRQDISSAAGRIFGRFAGLG